jgi:O-methyltransferase
MSRSFGLTPQIIDYLAGANAPEHPVLARCRQETAAHPMARMQISAEQGALMAFLTRLINARLAVEVGVFTGYSALATALALRANAGPGARLYACDISKDWTDIARGYWAQAQVEDTIDLRLAPAAETLEALAAEGLTGRIDLMFVDADKTGYLAYYEKGLPLLRPGGLMLFDNVLWSGRVADTAEADADTVALRTLAATVRDDPRVEQVMTGVGDGLLLVRKR